MDGIVVDFLMLLLLVLLVAEMEVDDGFMMVIPDVEKN